MTRQNVHPAVVSMDRSNDVDACTPFIRSRASTRVEDFGDGVAERVAFAADGTLTLEFDDGVDGWDDVECIVGIVVRGDFWAHAVEGDVEITTREAANTLAALVGAAARDGADARGCDVFVCPPAPFIADVARTVREMGDAG